MKQIRLIASAVDAIVVQLRFMKRGNRLKVGDGVGRWVGVVMGGICVRLAGEREREGGERLIKVTF